MPGIMRVLLGSVASKKRDSGLMVEEKSFCAEKKMN